MTLQKAPRAARRFARLMQFAGWLQSLPNRLTPPPMRLIQIGSAFWQSRALCVAAQLDLATVLGDEQLAVEVLACRTATLPDALYRLLRLLAAMGVFDETRPGVFGNNRLSTPLRQDRTPNVRALVLMHNSAAMSRPWYEHLEDGLRTGQVPFVLTHGQELYAYMDQHPPFDALFAQAMDSVALLTGESFASHFDWGRFTRIIDVGGSNASKSRILLKHHPHLNVLLYDRPTVIAATTTHWIDNPLSRYGERLSFEAGDLLQAVPPARDRKDIYLLSAILHGLDDQDCLKVLDNLARAAGNSGARVALMEIVVPTHKADLASAAFDMQMFIASSGRERTLAQWQALFARSSWRLEELINLPAVGKILVLA